MASESLTPPPSGGGYAKYLIVLLLLVGGGLGAYFASRKEPEPPKAAPPVQNAERSTALTPDTIDIPADEPAVEDAGVAATEPPKKPRPATGDAWSCAGDIPAANLRSALAEGSSAIRSCYERQLRNNNQLQGDVRLQVRIGNDGKVTGTRVTGTLHDAEVKSCMQNVAKGWSFPAPAGGTCAIFDAPFKFQPKN